MSQILEQIKEVGAKVNQQVLDSPAFNQLKDRYENLSPSGQKMVVLVGVLLIVFVLLFIPLTNLTVSQTSMSGFEDKRNLVRDLYKTYRESSATPDIETPPPVMVIKSSIESIIEKAELLPEQKLGIREATAEGRLIPQSMLSGVLDIQLVKLNLKQIVDIGSSLVAISNSIKMKDLSIIANREDTRYYDVTYKLYVLKVPEQQPEITPEPPPTNNRNRNNNK